MQGVDKPAAREGARESNSLRFSSRLDGGAADKGVSDRFPGKPKHLDQDTDS